MKTFNRGFTLLELLVVLAIVAILATVGVPSLQNTIKRNQVEAHLKAVATGVNFARSEAVSRGREVGICGSNNQSSCTADASSDWSAGWIVFVDDGAGGGTAGDALRNGGEEILRVVDYQGRSRVNVKDGAGTPAGVKNFSFDARGAVVQSIRATLRVCEPDGDASYARAMLLERTGRTIHAFDLYDSSSNPNPDNIYEDVKGVNLNCT